jgi:hypothetical protein
MRAHIDMAPPREESTTSTQEPLDYVNVDYAHAPSSEDQVATFENPLDDTVYPTA